MKTSEFLEFVGSTDLSDTDGFDPDERRRIATYGLASEIGSVLSALKKLLLKKSPTLVAQAIVKGELKEELGDALWYVGMCSNVLANGKDVFDLDLKMLANELVGDNSQQAKIDELSPEKIEAFVTAGKLFRAEPSLDNYQTTAFHTRRTEEDELRNVCAAVLQQLAAQLVRTDLPKSERNHHDDLADKTIEHVLGEIIWHLSALASLSELTLSEIVASLQDKTFFRNFEGRSTPRHDIDLQLQERFPIEFEIKFDEVEKGVSQMVWLRPDDYNTRLGAVLRDNNHNGDGYRFHDAMHIAFTVYLGWSPNLRKFMGIKRKSKPKIDEVEDGGRAQILEEMVILAVHTHAEKISEFLNIDLTSDDSQNPLADPASLSFEFIRNLRGLTKTYEVYKNTQQEWEDAIRLGYEMFHLLRKNKGGILVANTEVPSLNYKKLPS